MKYFKTVDANYILFLSTGTGQTEITETEYYELLDIVHTKPADPTGYVYMLNATTLGWELVERPPEPDPEAGISDYEQELEDLGVRLE